MDIRSPVQRIARPVLLSAALFTQVSCGQVDEATTVAASPEKPTEAEVIRAPEKIFADTCGYCHGHFIAPGITVIREIRGRNLPPALVKTYVRNGVGSMPAFRFTEISDAELDSLAVWIESSEAPPLPPMPPMPKPQEAGNGH